MSASNYLRCRSANISFPVESMADGVSVTDSVKFLTTCSSSLVDSDITVSVASSGNCTAPAKGIQSGEGSLYPCPGNGGKFVSLISIISNVFEGTVGAAERVTFVASLYVIDKYF